MCSYSLERRERRGLSKNISIYGKINSRGDPCVKCWLCKELLCDPFADLCLQPLVDGAIGDCSECDHDKKCKVYLHRNRNRTRKFSYILKYVL